MIKQKLKEFFLWLKDHFHCLVEVVVRLSLGIEKKEKPDEVDYKSTRKGDSDDR